MDYEPVVLFSIGKYIILVAMDRECIWFIEKIFIKTRPFDWINDRVEFSLN